MLEMIPGEVWQLPLPILILFLLVTGLIVTKREHLNMTAQMEYFRDLCDKKDVTISNQAEALNAYKEVAETATKTFETLQNMSREKRGHDVSS